MANAFFSDLLATISERGRTLLRRGESAEARFVKQIDRLETFLQSRVYHEQFPDAPMASFAQEVLETIDDPLLAAIRDEALKLQGPQ